MPVTVALLAVTTPMAVAQPASGNVLRRPAGIEAAGGSTTAASGGIALRGFCAVGLLKDRRWIVGSTEHQAVFDSKLYRFPTAAALAAFQADPAKYAPALGGDDVVTYARTGKRVLGKLAHGVRHLDRLFFFESEANKQAFAADPVQYTNADLAAGGACVVCRVDLNNHLNGDPRVTAVHDGLRYRFVGPQQRQTFLADPRRYTAPPRSPAVR